MVAPGGVRAELYGERAMAPAPCDEDSRRTAHPRMSRRSTRCSMATGATRPRTGRASSRPHVRIAALAAGLGPRLAALDLNPVIVGPLGAGATVVDARIVLDP